MISLIASIPLSLELRISHIQIGLLHTLIGIDSEGRLRTHFTTKEMIVSIGIPTVCCKTHPPNIATSLPIKDTSRLMISVSDNFLVESKWFI
jgi:hypothetical protein